MHYVSQRQNTFLFNMKCIFMLKMANTALLLLLLLLNQSIKTLHMYTLCIICMY